MAPRDGSNIYHRPAGTDGIPNYPIESSKYNSNVADVEQDLNLPRPIVAGGTGATNADDARFNLAAETATQIVTNYDSQIWTPGSFQSAVGATGAPISTSVFAGVCYIGEALANPPTNQNVVIEARDISSPIKPGPVYTRQKTAGVWSAWGTSGGGSDDASNRAAIYAAPFDAMAYSGLQINGGMEVSQENGGTIVTLVNAVNKYVVDGFIACYGNASAVFKATQFAWGSTLISSGIYFPYSLWFSSTTPISSLATGDFAILAQNIEGYRWAKLGWGTAAAQSVTISFWVFATVAGHASLAVRAGSAGRNYVVDFTVTGGIWEYKTVTIPGNTGGTWAKDNTTGANVVWTFAAGTGGQTAAGVWTNSNSFATSAQTNFFATANNVVQLTGVVILPGIEAPSAARSPLIMRPYDQELVTCKRYYNKLGNDKAISVIIQGTPGAGLFQSTTFPYPVEMRTTPSVSAAGFTLSNVASVAFNASSTCLGVQINATAAGTMAWYNATAGVYLALDARL